MKNKSLKNQVGLVIFLEKMKMEVEKNLSELSLLDFNDDVTPKELFEMLHSAKLNVDEMLYEQKAWLEAYK